METMQVNGREFTVKKLLGKGKGGYSWLVRDDTGEYVLKQIHQEPCDYYQFGDKLASELRDYERLSQLGIPMPALLAVDAENERLLKTYIDGPTIAELVKAYGMRPEYLQQVENMCHVLYTNGLNIDYYPTNFIVKDDVLVYIDYECNEYSEQWNFENWGMNYWKKVLSEKEQ